MSKTKEELEETQEIRRSAMSMFIPPNTESLKERLIREVLPNIVSSGDATKTVSIFINKDISKVLDLHSGSPRINRTAAKRLTLILSQPAILSNFNPFEIRCSLCKRVVSYPCWYYEVKYAVNHFHYFVCFSDNDKPTVKCYRKV